MDLTSLNEQDTAADIVALCAKALEPVQVAAVCVYPQFVELAAAHLTDTGVAIATVVNFPEGNAEYKTVYDDIKRCVKEGATEIDVVFPYTAFLKEETGIKEFLQKCKKNCKSALLKVILETGALGSVENIKTASALAIEAGADFLKTSTGKMAQGASVEAATAMLQTIKESGADVGIKISGGVRSLDQALPYLNLAEKIMGAAWITPQHFRFGASQLWTSACEKIR